jgi:hypothetical protein
MSVTNRPAPCANPSSNETYQELRRRAGLPEREVVAVLQDAVRAALL